MAASTPQAFANWKEKQKMTQNASTSGDAPGVGHNSEPRPKVAKDQLKSFVERVERLEEEKKAIADDIRDVIAEAKGNGFDATALRSLVKLRKMDPQVRQEREAILDTYKSALGMLD